MTNASSSRRKTNASASDPSEASAVTANPSLNLVTPADQPYSNLLDVTVPTVPTAPTTVPIIPELEPTDEPRSGGAPRGRQPYVNPLMPLLRRLRRQDPNEIKPEETHALHSFLTDTTGEVRVNSIFLSEAVMHMSCELYERYSRTALTVAIHLGTQSGTGVPAAKREISRATSVVIGESNELTGFPRHLGLDYTVNQLTKAVAFLNEAYGDNGTLVPGAITAANEALRQKNEAAGRTNRY